MLSAVTTCPRPCILTRQARIFTNPRYWIALNRTMSSDSQGFRAPLAGARRSGSPPSVCAQPPLKKQRIGSTGLPNRDPAPPTPERRTMDPSMATDSGSAEAPLPGVNPVPVPTKFGASAGKRVSDAARPQKKQARKKKRVTHEAASPGDVLWHEVQRIIGVDVAKGIVEARQEFASPFKFGDEIVVEVLEIGAGGASRSIIVG